MHALLSVNFIPVIGAPVQLTFHSRHSDLASTVIYVFAVLDDENLPSFVSTHGVF